MDVRADCQRPRAFVANIAASNHSEYEAMATKPELLGEIAAADFIAMSVPFLQAGRSRGITGNRTPTPPYLKLGRLVKYDVRDLETWLLARRVDPEARKASARISMRRASCKKAA